jgi:hypothetical protein
MSWDMALVLAYLSTGAGALWLWPSGGVIVGAFWLVTFAYRIADNDPPWDPAAERREEGR